MNRERARKVLIYLPAALLFIGALWVLSGIFPYGDDLFYGMFARRSALNFIERHREHYFLANGRVIVHILASVFLSLDLWIWRVLNALLLAAASLLAAGVSGVPRDRRAGAALVSACVIALLPVSVTRQSVYWLDGSFNYVYPMVMLLLYWTVLRKSVPEGKGGVLLPVLAFFAAATTEQGSVMAFGLTLLVLLDTKFFKKLPLRRMHLIALAAAAAGMLTVLLAPANLYRAAAEGSPAEGGLLSLVVYNFKHLGMELFFSDHLLPVHVLCYTGGLLSLGRALRRLSGKLHAAGVLALCGGACSFALYFWVMAGPAKLPLSAITTRMGLLLAAVAGGYVLLLVMSAVSALLLRKNGSPLIALILGFGSQLMLLVSPVTGPRTLLAFVFMAMVFAAEALAEHHKLGAPLAAGGILAAVYGHPLILPISCAALVLLWTAKPAWRRRALTAVWLPLLLVAALTLRDTATGYAASGAVYRENLEAIAVYDPAAGEPLVQSKLPDDAYGWVMPYHNDYYDSYYRAYYGLGADTEIIWTEPQPIP